jgi:hypothetical protein
MLVKNANNWGGLNAEDNGWLDAMWNRYVPACGKAATLGGEILRAINRIIYKFYNDGDTVARYYSSSYNHSFGAEWFLIKHVTAYSPMRDITNDYAFEECACDNLKKIVDYLRENPQLFETPNEEDFLDLSPYEEWPDEDEDYDEWEDEENEGVC